MSEITIIENTKEARDEHGHAWGSSKYILSTDHIEALSIGKCIAIDQGEYVLFLILGETK